MAQFDHRSQPAPARRNDGDARAEGRSSDRQPREEPNRQSLEAPPSRESARDPSVNQPHSRDRVPSPTGEEIPSGSRRPGGSGDAGQ